MNWLSKIFRRATPLTKPSSAGGVDSDHLQKPIRHLTIHNFLGKLRAELYLKEPPGESTDLSFNFYPPKSGWSQFEIIFVDIGHFVCMISDMPNDFYGDLAKALAEKRSVFSVAAHMEPDTIAFYVADSVLYLCKFDDYESYESSRDNQGQMINHAFMSVGFSSEYVFNCLKNLGQIWPQEPNKDWAHEFPHALFSA